MNEGNLAKKSVKTRIFFLALLVTIWKNPLDLFELLEMIRQTATRWQDNIYHMNKAKNCQFEYNVINHIKIDHKASQI